MNVLGAIMYDPGSAVTKATSSNLAMTAFDTTNLRLTVTVPAHGFLRFKIACAHYGPGGGAAGKLASIFLGVLTSAGAIVFRAVPFSTPNTADAVSKSTGVFVDVVVGGLSAGSTSFDAAYAVQILQASAAIKYGGPDDATGNDAWGGFSFEIYDPRPLPTAAPAAVGGLLTAPTTANVGTVDAVRLLGTTISTPAVAGVMDTNTIKIENADPTDTIRDSVLNDATRFAGASIAAIKAKTDLIPAGGPPAASDYTAARAAKLDNLDATVSSRLASASYTAPDNTGIAAIQAKTDNLPPDPADASDIAAAFAALTSDVAGIPVAVWAAGTRTLSSFGTLVADVWAAVLETGFSASRLIRIIAAAVAGKSTGGPGGFTARNLPDTQDQLTGTADTDGNRTPSSFGS